MELDYNKKDIAKSPKAKAAVVELPEGVTPTITDRDFTIATLQSPGGGVKNEEDEEVESTESSEETETE